MTEDQTALGTMREEDQRPWLHLLLELQGKASERNMLGLRDKLCEALSKLRALLKSSPPSAVFQRHEAGTNESGLRLGSCHISSTDGRHNICCEDSS